MAKYKLKALNCYLGGKLRRKEENEVFDSTNFDKKEFDSVVSGGFLQEIKKEKTEKVEEAKGEEKTEKVESKKKSVNG